MARINVDTTYIIGNNGISRDAKKVVEQLKLENEIFEVQFLNLSLNENRALRRFLNTLNLLFNLHIPIGRRYRGIFYQPHLSALSPGKRSTGWVIRLHDLFPITNPEWFRWWACKVFKRNLKFAVKNGAFFLFSSNYSKNVFLNLHPGCVERVALSPCVTSSLNQSLCNNCEGCREIETNPDQRSTLLAVGTVEPRKNYELIIDFWNLYGKSLPDVEKLIVIGSPGWKSERTQLALSQLTKAKWVKNSCDGSLNYFYKNAKYFVSASKDEGFNLPALEARINYGIPVFLSDIPVHHETHGDRATYFKGPQDLFTSIATKQETSSDSGVAKCVIQSSNLIEIFTRFDK
jgi:glycosyltransferase involved in cell wall biosynthesis